MGRLLSVILISAVLLSAALLSCARGMGAQPVFFSMLFEQLVPEGWLEATPGEAVFL